MKEEKKTKELSVIVTSYKKTSLLELCLNHLLSVLKGIEYEIIVTDSATEEETYDLMREKFSSLIFLPNLKNIGFAKLVNQGLRIAKGKFIFIINSDIIIKDRIVYELISYFKKDPQVGMIGPQLINFDGSVQPSSFRFYSFPTILYRRTFLANFKFARKKLDDFLMVKERKKGKPFECDWLMGSAMLVKKEAVEKVGKMDENYFMYFEDVDWCWRFWEKGYRVIHYPLVKVYHYHGKQSLQYKNSILEVLFNKYTRFHIKSAWRFFLKFRGKDNPRLKNNKKIIIEKT